MEFVVFACYENNSPIQILAIKIPSVRVVNYAKLDQAYKTASKTQTVDKIDLFALASMIPVIPTEMVITRIKAGELVICININGEDPCSYGLGGLVDNGVKIAFSMHILNRKISEGEEEENGAKQTYMSENDQYVILADQPCQLLEAECHPRMLAKIQKICEITPTKTRLAAAISIINHYFYHHSEIYKAAFRF
jgi:hypothetical protein